MTETLSCDFCSTSTPSERRGGWYRVEALGNYQRVVKPKEVHFCSPKCVLGYFEGLKLFTGHTPRHSVEQERAVTTREWTDS